MSVRILLGDVRAKLAELPDESVHCVVTSPPYFGLRDYGTASWEGGDPACDHKQGTARQDGGRVRVDGFNGSAKPDSDKGPMNYRDVCGKCGATRTDKQIGLEPTPAEFVQVMVEVFREVRRVLRKDGTCWINLGDSYNANQGAGFDTNQDGGERKNAPGVRTPKMNTGLPAKNLLGIPWRVAFALQADGWYLRQDIIWAKPNPMPESVTDRCTKAHEYLFLMSKSPRYHFDAEAISEPLTQSSIDRLLQPNLENQEGSWRVPGKTNGAMKAKRRKPQGWNTSANYHNADPRYAPRQEAEDYVAPVESDRRNKRSVWTVATQPFKEAHFATFPPDLIEPCIKAGCPKDCCAKCGAPVVREVENGSPTGRRDNGAGDGLTDFGMYSGRAGSSTRVTLGWLPSCTCDAGLVRGVCLDPFGGAGTTGLVADRLQRDAILIELNPAYAEIARERIKADGSLFAEVA